MEKETYKLTHNFYRTKSYIVKQEVYLKVSQADGNYIFSHDIYYIRNSFRDKVFEDAFKNRENVNGKRIHTSMHTRIYYDQRLV